jgi:putative membrane protein insertion efficiency factor
MSTAAALALRGAVRAYQWTLRPVLGCNCRFHPSCSDYALEALATHGALRGAALAGARILRCNPWHPGGHDPVPLPRAAAAAARPGQQG